MGSRELVGRDAEAAALRAALDDSRPVVLLGESGIGKTSLVESVLAADGRPVRRGGGLATLSWMPYLAVARAVGRTSFDLDEVAAVADLVEREVGADVLFVDDLHACDAGSLDVIALLTSRLTVVSAVRLGHAGADAALSTVRSAGFEEVGLQPLGQADSRRVVLAAAPGLAPERVRRVVESSGGVPLLLEELAQGGTGTGLTPELRSRLDRLDVDARWSAVLLSIAGRPLADDLAGTEDLVSARIADRPAPGLVQVRHALLAAAILEDVGVEEVRRAHLAIAGRSVDPLVRAFHLLEGGRAAQAKSTALSVADGAEPPGRRAEALLLASRSSDAEGRLDPDLLVRAAAGLVGANRGADAITVLDRVPESGVPAATWGRRCALMAMAAWQVGDEAALTSSLAAAASVEDSLPADVLLDLRYAQASYAVLVLSTGDLAAAETACDGLDAAAAAAGRWQGRALMRRGTLAAMHAQDEALELLRAAMDLCREEGDVEGEMAAANNLADTLASAGRVRESYALMTTAAPRAASLGLVEWSAQFRGMAGLAAGYLGMHAECLAMCEEAGAASTDVRTRLLARDTSLLSVLELGDTDVVLREVHSIRADAGAVPEVLATCAYLEATALWHQGRLEEALAAAADTAIEGRVSYISLVRAVQDWATFEAGRSLDDFQAKGSQAEQAGAVLEHDAVVALAAGRLGEAAELFDRAAEVWESRWRFAELRCRWAAVDARRAAGDPSAVAELLALEEQVAELSFAWLMRKVQRSLRVAGVARSAPRGIDRRALLSAREQEVLSLAAEGRTDPEIARHLGLGVPTVRRHVGNAVLKLGVPTRNAAVASYAAGDGIAS